MMTIPRLKRFAIERILAPRSVCVIGGETPDGARVLLNLRAAGFQGEILPDGAGEPDLAVICAPPPEVAAAMRRLGNAGGTAAIVTSVVPNLAELVAETGVRALGPSSFGVAVPRIGLNASLSHMPVPKGNIALVTQSAALARSVVDWAGPNGVGFSAIVGVNGNANMGFAVIDYLSRDPATKLIMLDIRRIRSRRAFVSAARAASRLRPVVALRPGGLLLDPSGRSEAVFEAGLKRAGVFAVHKLEAFLAAAETFSRSTQLRGETMAVVTNGIGPGRLAADAALEAGIKLAVLPPDAQAGLTASLPADLIHGLIYAGASGPADIGSIAAMVSAVPCVGGVLVLLAPSGDGDAVAVESIVAAAHAAKLPMLTCVMGETTGAPHRRRLAEAGLPVFPTPEQAVQAFTHLLRDRQAKQAMRELPPGRVLAVAPDHATATAVTAASRAANRLALTREEALRLLAAYGFAAGPHPAGATAISIRVHDDEIFGPAIGCAMLPGGRAAYDLPPLNLPLAASLARRAGLTGASDVDEAAQALVRVSQLIVDMPDLAALALDPLALGKDGAVPLDAAVWLRPAGDLAVLAIPPYPEHLEETWSAKGETFLIRPIRPEDAEAHAAFIARVPPEDLRYRFFTALRTVSPEQMARLTQIDYEREMAFIAVRLRDNATVGVSRLVRELDGRRGEFAILVQPDTKGLGLARRLMERLTEWAVAQKIPEIAGQVLADNAPMLAFMRRIGFTVHAIPDETDIVECVLEVEGAARAA
jgi:acetyltransferase